jgi:branched-subunit amino acid transport protein
VKESYIPLIIAAAVLTYFTRYGGLALGKRNPPAFVSDFLGYVPIAAFAALVLPDLASGGDERFPRLFAAGIAALVVYQFGKLWACIAVGMAVYWLTRGVF